MHYFLMLFRWIDLVSLVLIVYAKIKGDETAAHLKRMDQEGMTEKIKMMGDTNEVFRKAGILTPEMEADYKDVVQWEIAKRTVFGFSPKSWSRALVLGVLSLALGWSSLPGMFFGLLISSPYYWPRFVLFFFPRRSGSHPREEMERERIKSV